MRVIIMAEVSHVSCTFKKIHALVHAGVYGCHERKIPSPLADCSGPVIIFGGTEDLEFIMERVNPQNGNTTTFGSGARFNVEFTEGEPFIQRFP
jgi:hypothetical protein